jgi:hypothetical protein
VAATLPKTGTASPTKPPLGPNQEITEGDVVDHHGTATNHRLTRVNQRLMVPSGTDVFPTGHVPLACCPKEHNPSEDGEFGEFNVQINID